MKEKVPEIIGITITVVGYIVLKVLFVGMGVNKFMSTVLALIVPFVVIFGVCWAINAISNKFNSDHRDTEENNDDENTEEESTEN